ncbi:MAG: hypothetical protein ABJC13_02190 [Acidobacteriota bacterium]
MPTKSYALEPDGPKRLTVSWKGRFEDLHLTLDGREVLHVASSTELEAGRSTTLPDGRDLRVQLMRSFRKRDLYLDLDGKHLPGSAGEPLTRIWNVVGLIYFIGGLSFLVGLAAEIFSIPLLLSAGLGWGACLVGLVFVALGFWLQKRQSPIALSLAIGLIALDMLTAIYSFFQEGPHGGAGSLLIKTFFLIAMSRGYAAIRENKELQASA